MLFPYSHLWTPLQKRLILASASVGLVALIAGVCVYERYYRGPGEEVFYGTWEAAEFLNDESVYFRFDQNHTFAVGTIYENEFSPFTTGRWYAGGPNLYLRFSAEDMGPSRPWIFRIQDIQPHELHLLIRGRLYTFRRSTVMSSTTSNHAMERTPDRRALHS